MTSRQFDRLLFVNIAMTTGAFAQTAVLRLVMASEVASGREVDFVIVMLDIVMIDSSNGS